MQGPLSIDRADRERTRCPFTLDITSFEVEIGVVDGADDAAVDNVFADHLALDWQPKMGALVGNGVHFACICSPHVQCNCEKQCNTSSSLFSSFVSGAARIRVFARCIPAVPSLV
jgi:hypothetical protein